MVLRKALPKLPVPPVNKILFIEAEGLFTEQKHVTPEHFTVSPTHHNSLLKFAWIKNV